jgi:prephenate dehydratase
MARSDTLRKEIASLEDEKAGYAKVIAAQEKVAATAREAARKKRDQASRSKNTSTIRSVITGAEREEKKVAAIATPAALEPGPWATR